MTAPARTLRGSRLGALLILGTLAASLGACSFEGDESQTTQVDEHAEALVSDNGLAMNRLAANRLAANRIALNKLAANRIALNKLAANRLAANRLAANRISGNKLAANRIAGNRLAANRIAGNKLAANRLAANRLAANRISGNRLAANRIALNKLATNRLAANRLAANRIALNRLAANRIALNGLVANGSVLSQPLVDQGLSGEFTSQRQALSELELNGFGASLEGKDLEWVRSPADYVPFTDFVTNNDPSFVGKLSAALLDSDPLDSSTQDKELPQRIEIDADSVGSLLTTEDGREVMKYMVSCALSEDQILVGSYAGTNYEFAGSLGLAPTWTQTSLSESDQRWVSACLFARVNAHGISVEVSLRGAHPQLSVSADEMATWSLEEGAFWGNLFAPGDEIDWNACEGLDQLEGEQGALEDRDCTEPDVENPGFTVCGLKSAGICGARAEQTACRSFDTAGMYYSECAADGAPAVTEVVTTFVRATR